MLKKPKQPSQILGYSNLHLSSCDMDNDNESPNEVDHMSPTVNQFEVFNNDGIPIPLTETIHNWIEVL